MERYCPTGQSPQRAIAPKEEEEEGEEKEEEEEEEVCFIQLSEAGVLPAFLNF
jgi:hypothetical protein